jgi:putative transposase
VPARKHNVEEIVATLRQMEQLTGEGMSVSAAAKTMGITDQTYYRWRARYGSMPEDEAKRLQVLDEENARLKRAITEQSLDVSMLQDLTQGEILSAARRREAVDYLVHRYRISERRACRLVGQHRSTQRYGTAGQDENGLANGSAREPAGFDDGFPSSSPGPGPGEPGWEVPTQGWRSTLIETEVDAAAESDDGADAEVDAEAARSARSWRTGVEEGRPLRAVEEPDDAPHRPPPRAVKTSFLEGRIRCVRRLQTSLLHDVVWLARDSETARLFGADAVIFGLQDLAATPRRLVHLFREDDEEPLGSAGH